jgi:hypothetical protein
MRVIALFVGAAMLAACGFGPTGPSCERRTGAVLAANGTVPKGGSTSYEVTSPASSNLHIRLTWSNRSASLGLRATIRACGTHAGCFVGLTDTAPTDAPLSRELQVDGSRDKKYRIDVLGDANIDQDFTIDVQYDTGGCT